MSDRSQYRCHLKSVFQQRLHCQISPPDCTCAGSFSSRIQRDKGICGEVLCCLIETSVLSLLPVQLSKNLPGSQLEAFPVQVASPLVDTLGCGIGFPELKPSAQLNKRLVHHSPIVTTVEVCKGRHENLPANVRHHTSLHKKVTKEHAEGKKEVGLLFLLWLLSSGKTDLHGGSLIDLENLPFLCFVSLGSFQLPSLCFPASFDSFCQNPVKTGVRIYACPYCFRKCLSSRMELQALALASYHPARLRTTFRVCIPVFKALMSKAMADHVDDLRL